MNEDEIECLFCGEYVMKHKDKMIHDKKGQPFHTYSCEDCDQLFVGMDDGGLGVLPMDSQGKPTEVKCDVCGHLEEHRQKMQYIVKEDMFYSAHCTECAISRLKNWDGKKPEVIVDKDNIAGFVETYNMIIMQEVMNNPEKRAKALSTPKMQGALKEMGIPEERLKKLKGE